MVPFMQQILSIAEIVASILLIASVLLQQQSAGIGGAFGGDSIHHTRRGSERWFFIATIALSFVFLGLAFANFLLS